MKTTYIISSVQNTIKIFNAKTGFLVKSFIIPGELINGPIQAGEQFTIIVKVNNRLQGKIYKLPTCFLVKTFSV